MLLFAQVLAKFSTPRQAHSFRLSGLINEFPGMNSLADVAAALRERFIRFHRGDPWSLLWDCSSGLVAVELARQIHEQAPEMTPRHDIVCDTQTNAFLATTGLQTRFQTPAYLEKYYELLFAWRPAECPFPLHFITSGEFAERCADPIAGLGRPRQSRAFYSPTARYASRIHATPHGGGRRGDRGHFDNLEH